MELDIYENIFIGNFIYLLGLRIGMNIQFCDSPREVPACVNLLQQTPLDKSFSDMLASFEGISFLIEFKKKSGDVKKEKKKRNQLWQSIKDNDEMNRISRLAHWFVQVDVLKNGELNTGVVPYLDLDNSDLATTESFDEFLEKIVKKIFKYSKADDVVNVGVSGAAMSRYLKCVREIFNAGSGGTSKQHKLGGLIINVSPTGGLSYAVLADITRSLDLSHKAMRDICLDNPRGVSR